METVHPRPRRVPKQGAYNGQPGRWTRRGRRLRRFSTPKIGRGNIETLDAKLSGGKRRWSPQSASRSRSWVGIRVTKTRIPTQRSGDSTIFNKTDQVERIENPWEATSPEGGSPHSRLHRPGGQWMGMGTQFLKPTFPPRTVGTKLFDQKTTEDPLKHLGEKVHPRETLPIPNFIGLVVRTSNS